MQYALTEEQELLRQTVARLARERVAPRAAEIDARGEYPWDMVELLKRNQLLGLPYPEDYGGSGAGWLTCCLVVEEIARYCQTTAHLLLSAFQPWAMMKSEGRPEQLRRRLPPVARGEARVGLGITEPEAGSDVAAIRTRAVRQGDFYLLTGNKCFTSNSPIADYFFVLAKTDPQAGAKGITCFIVERGSPGLSIGKEDRKIGLRGVPQAEVILEECPVPQENLLGQEGQGFAIAMNALNTLRPIVAARGVGLAQGALDYAIQYAKERIVFGQAVASFQGIQFQVAEMATQIEASRHLTYRAASLLDLGRGGREVAGVAAMAKFLATEVAMSVAVGASQLLGGYGCMEDYPMERYIRDAKVLQVEEGTPHIQRLIIARSIL